MADSWWNWGRKILIGDRLDQSGPQPVRTPQTDRPSEQPYRRNQHGVLGWLRDTFGGWLGRQEALGTPASAEVKTEKVRSGPSGIVMPWFAPFLDNQTNETQAMRLAYREMWRDPNVKAALLGKIFSVCSMDLNIIPADKRNKKHRSRKNADPRHEQIAEFVRWNLTERVQGCLPEIGWAILSGGLTDGYSISEKVWGYEESDEYQGHYALTALKPKDTGNDVVLLTDEYRNIVGIKAMRYNGGEIYPPSNFVIYQHTPMYGSPVGLSDLRAVYGRWWMLDTVLKLRAMGLEKRALPMLMGEYETTAQKPSVEAAMSLARSQSWMSIPKGVRITTLEMAGSADSQFASAVADLKEDIFLAIQGATLQALAGQEGTMRGSSAVHKNTADLFRWHLARQLEVILNDRDSGLIRDIVDLNYVTDRYPKAVLGAVELDELVQKSQLHQNLIQMGLKLSKRELYEEYSVTPPDPDDPDDALGGEKEQPPGGGAPPEGQPPAPETPPPEGGDGQQPDDSGDGGGGLLSALQFAEEFAEEDWTHDPTGRSQNRWKNTKTGRIQYSKENPGKSSRQKKPAVAPAGGGNPAPTPAPTPQDKQPVEKPQKGASKTPGKDKPTPGATDTPKPSEGEQGGLLGQLHKEGSTPEQVANILGGAKYKDLQALAKQVGEKANGKTHELADRILKAFLASKGQGGGEKKPDPAPVPTPTPPPVPDHAPVPKPAPQKATKEQADAATLKKLEAMKPKDGVYKVKGDPEGRKVKVEGGKVSFHTPAPLVQKPELEPKKPEPEPEQQQRPVVDEGDTSESGKMQFREDEEQAAQDNTAPFEGADRKILSAYIKDDYVGINGALRSGADENHPDTKRAIQLNDKIKSLPKLKKPITVYRGMQASGSEHAREYMKKLLASKPGDEVEMLGLTSTSHSPDVANSLGGLDDDSIVMEIQANHGASVTGALGEDVQGEKEFLIPHGAKMRVVGIKEEEVLIAGTYPKKVRKVILEQV